MSVFSSSRASWLARRMPLDTRPARNQLPVLDRCLGELERHVRVRAERVGEGDTVVAVRDVPFRYENRATASPRPAPSAGPSARPGPTAAAGYVGGPQDVVGAASDDRELPQLRRTSCAWLSPWRMLR